jgi:hypothetical protein
MSLRKKIRLDYRAANDGLDIRALRDEGIVDVPDALSDDAESVYELDDENMSNNCSDTHNDNENMSNNCSDTHNDNDGDIISDKTMGVEPEYQQRKDKIPNTEVLESHEGRNVTLWSFFKTTSTGLKYRHTTGKLREDRHMKCQVPKCSHVGYRDRNLKGSASNLKTHLTRTHGLSEADIRRGFQTWIESKSAIKTASSIKTKIEIQMATSQTSKVRDEVLSLFARQDLPLSLIEDHGFQKLLLWASNTRLTSNTSQHKIANAPVKSRRTLQRLLDEAKSSFLNNLKEILLSDECVSLNVAFDGWTP